MKEGKKTILGRGGESQGSDVSNVPLCPYLILWQSSHWLQWEYDLAGERQAEQNSFKAILMHCFPFLTLTNSFPFFFFSLSLLFSSLLLMQFLYSNRKVALQQPRKCCTQKTHQGPSRMEDDNNQIVWVKSKAGNWNLQSDWLITTITQCLHQSKSEWKKQETKKKIQVKSMGLGNIESVVNLLKWLLISLMFFKTFNSERRHSITRTITYKMKANVWSTETFGIFCHSRKRTSAPVAMQTATGSKDKARRVR